MSGVNKARICPLLSIASGVHREGLLTPCFGDRCAWFCGSPDNECALVQAGKAAAGAANALEDDIPAVLADGKNNIGRA